ncbi:APC membrane recruitment protein 3 [Phascolarctos cinereus]|uniref:APC membrane recruitment protein 3 n=1 Tax=Phascolarctos cinereus TaxID=38626 RepID=A0A6P5IP27_PHACI|nr:APC membrane recruitment protein 3 [Phascolarctos cinereus]
MELRRGKTFIKSSLQISNEKPIVAEAAFQSKEAGAFRSRIAATDGGPLEEESQKAGLASHKHYRFSNKVTHLIPDEDIGASCGSSYKLVRKSKTHDCVMGADKPVGRLVNSISFSGLGSHPGAHGRKAPAGSPSPSSCSGQQMIDYRHFVPQMPFVPAVAKSIPRKRISLKRSKKGFRDIFHIRKNKSESLAMLMGKGKNLPSPGGEGEIPGRLGKAFFKPGETLAADSLAQDLSDSEIQSDSSYDYCGALCEDVASLKSFDSLTGCGEIFADEVSASLELEGSQEILTRRPRARENTSAMGSFQGGVEQLASPAQNEATDFAKFWDNINWSVRRHQSALFDRKLEGSKGSDAGRPKYEPAMLPDLPLSPGGDPDSSKDSSIDTGTPKSEHQESTSTSDEGYYDSFSPGLEDDGKEAQSPGAPSGRFPRDSYSGDALYELFYDPSEAKISPILDDELCVSESLSEQAVEIPLSIYSFHVGAEENLAPQPALDIISQSFLHSTWKGKECLLKLCDTELSLTMGIINWLRRNPELVSPSDRVQTLPSPIKASGDLPACLGLPLGQEAEGATLPMGSRNEGSSERETDNPEPLSLSEQVTDKRRFNHGTVEKHREVPQREDFSPGTPDEGYRCASDVYRSWLATMPHPSAGGWQMYLPEKDLGSSESRTLGEAPLATGGPSKELLHHPSQVSTEKGKGRSSSEASSQPVEAEEVTLADTLDEHKAQSSSSYPSAHEKPSPSLSLKCFRSQASPGLKRGEPDIMPVLESCMTQVASLKISYENKPLAEWCLRKEEGSTLCKRQKVGSHCVLLQNECNCIPASSGYPLLSPTGKLQEVPMSPNQGLSPWQNQKSQASFLNHMRQVSSNKINFEYAQLNGQALSYIQDLHLQFSPGDPSVATQEDHQKLIPLFAPSDSVRPGALPQASCAGSSSPQSLCPCSDKNISGPTSGSPLECHHNLLAHVGPLPCHAEVMAASSSMAETNL